MPAGWFDDVARTNNDTFSQKMILNENPSPDYDWYSHNLSVFRTEKTPRPYFADSLHTGKSGLQTLLGRSIQWLFIDGYKFYEVTIGISSIEEYMILSMELPLKMEELKDAVFPDVFMVDYVRVYKRQ